MCEYENRKRERQAGTGLRVALVARSPHDGLVRHSAEALLRLLPASVSCQPPQLCLLSPLAHRHRKQTHAPACNERTFFHSHEETFVTALQRAYARR